jgi:hypothetical protein
LTGEVVLLVKIEGTFAKKTPIKLTPALWLDL